MQKVIGVRFKKAGKIHLFDPGDEDIQRGDSVIVETSRGLECGEVALGVREIPAAENSPEPRKISRKATPADLERVEENRHLEQEAFEICQQKIEEHALPMNLINVNYTFDLNKIIFYFTAEGRVDFRALVRDLAYIFHTRIDLRQVGVRDEAKLLGGIGCCGRALCCSTFLGDFAPVSIRMAKEQNLSLNPTKISGICGRLLCCLKYESDYYHESYVEQAQNFQPKPGDFVVVEDGVSGKVVSVNASRRNATILLADDKTVVSSWEDLMPLDNEEVAQMSKPVEEPAPPPERERPRRQNSRQPRSENPPPNNLFDKRPPRSDKPAKNSGRSHKNSKRGSKK